MLFRSSDFQRIFRQKMKERQEFLERFASETKEYKAAIDYSKRHGMFEEINQTVNNLEQREKEEVKAVEEEKKKALKEKQLEVVRGEEIKPVSPVRRIKLDSIAPAGETGTTSSSKSHEESKYGAPAKIDREGKTQPKTEPKKKAQPDEEGVKDE